MSSGYLALNSKESTGVLLTDGWFFGKCFYLWEQPIGCCCLPQLSSCYKAQGAASATTTPTETDRVILFRITGCKLQHILNIQTWYRKHHTLHSAQATAQYRPCFCLVTGDWRRLWWPEDIGPAAFQCCCRTALSWWRRGGAGWSPTRFRLTDAPTEARRSPQTETDHTGQTGDRRIQKR